MANQGPPRGAGWPLGSRSPGATRSVHPVELLPGRCVPVSNRQNDGSTDTTSLYVWLSRDKAGIEGIIMVPDPSGGVLALVCADHERALKLQPLAHRAAMARGFPAHLVRFERREQIDTTR